MLVLTRKVGERIYIGDNITVTVLEVDRGKCRIGIEAPRNVAIYRQELLPLAHPPTSSVMNPKPDRIETAWGPVDNADES